MEEPPVDRVPRGRGIFRRFRGGGVTPEPEAPRSDQPDVRADEGSTEPDAPDSVVVLDGEPRDRPGDVSKDVKGETVKVRICRREGCGEELDR